MDEAMTLACHEYHPTFSGRKGGIASGEVPHHGGGRNRLHRVGLVSVTSIPRSRSAHPASISASGIRGTLHPLPPMGRSWAAAPVLSLLAGCDGAPSRNILGSYFPSWMVCALAGIALALIARAIFKASGLLDEIPVPFVVMLSIAIASTFGLWLLWLS